MGWMLDVLKMLIFVFVHHHHHSVLCFLWLICASIRSSYSSVLITGCKDCETNNNKKERNIKIMKNNTTCCMDGVWSMDLAFDPVRRWYTKYVSEYKNQFGWRKWRLCHNFIRKQWKKGMTPFSAHDDWNSSWARKSIWLQLKINNTIYD